MHRLAVNYRPVITHTQTSNQHVSTVTTESCLNSQMSSLLLLHSTKSSLVGQRRATPCAHMVQPAASLSCEFQESAHWQGRYGDSAGSCCEKVHTPLFNCPSMLPALPGTSHLLWNIFDSVFGHLVVRVVHEPRCPSSQHRNYCEVM